MIPENEIEALARREFVNYADNGAFGANLPMVVSFVREIERMRDAWLPIESAPKTGELVLLWTEQWLTPQSGCYYGSFGWSNLYESGPWKHQPTHWQPLPPAPKEDK